ncbi:ATPase [Paenibacillus silvisoli]|uniref:ATPase n=1 Tax=Paenibacillus silvisoli TaxID=3110539 RepID=UPI0028043701|nr:ATPase [Paenibacillus silvisoli]
MYKLSERIIIVSDLFEQNLPVGEYGYIIAYDRNADNAFDYVIRVPKANRNFYVPAADIELEEVLIKQEADRLEREALIDFALATHNEELFRRIMNGDAEPEEEQPEEGEPQTREEFMRQVRLKAWI